MFFPMAVNGWEGVRFHNIFIHIYLLFPCVLLHKFCSTHIRCKSPLLFMSRKVSLPAHKQSSLQRTTWWQGTCAGSRQPFCSRGNTRVYHILVNTAHSCILKMLKRSAAKFDAALRSNILL